MQNTEEGAHQQLDYAFDVAGLNFLDTAEMCAALCGAFQRMLPVH